MTTKDLQNILSIFPGVEVKERNFHHASRICIELNFRSFNLFVVHCDYFGKTVYQAVNECCLNMMETIIKSGLDDLIQDAMIRQGTVDIKHKPYFRKAPEVKNDNPNRQQEGELKYFMQSRKK